MEEGSAIARVTRNPFGLKEKGNAMMENGILLETEQQLTKAFVDHNLKTGEVEEIVEEAEVVEDGAI